LDLAHGELRVWGKKKTVRRYFDHGEWRYWPMTTDPDESILLNRAKIAGDKSSPMHSYDEVAAQYDQIWSGPQALAEDKEIMSMLAYNGNSVLDIGCGTGLFLDHHPDAQSYFGCDPSMAMLNRLTAKHPDAIVYPLTFEECLPALNGTKYDYVISLFGSPSYINPRSLAKIDSILKPDGRLFLMFCSPAYSPVTHDYINSPPSLYVHHFMAYGTVSTFGNYTIVQR
jgi:SAM-dependent methyltransferase